MSGDYVIVGSPFHGATDIGAAYIYHRGGGWIPGHGYIAKLTANDGLANDFFGYSVCIDGDYAIVGAYGDDGSAGVDQGSAYLYYKGSAWMQLNHFYQKVTAIDAGAGDNFGYSVSIHGAYAAIGAFLDDVQPNTNHGSAYIFFRTAGSWSYQTKLTAFDGQPGDLFGKGVSIYGDYVAIGAYGDKDLNQFEGSAYIFKRTGTGWALVRKVEDDYGQIESRFGYALSVSGFNVIIGAYLKNNRRGQAFFLNME